MTDQIVAALVVQRKRLGMSQAQLAKSVGCTQSMISEFECRKCGPSLRTATRLAAALGMEIVCQLAGTNE